MIKEVIERYLVRLREARHLKFAERVRPDKRKMVRPEGVEPSTFRSVV